MDLRVIDYFAIAMFVGVLAVGTYERNKAWCDEVTLLQDIVKKSPCSVRPRSNLGAYLLLNNRYEEALPHLLKAVELAGDNKEYFYAWFNLSVCYEQMGDHQNAYKYARQAALLQKDTNTLTLLGKILKESGWTVEEN